MQGLKRTEQNALVELLKTKMTTHSVPTTAGALPELKEDKEKDDTPVQPPPTHEQMDAGATAPASSGIKFTKIISNTFSKRTSHKASSSN